MTQRRGWGDVLDSDTGGTFIVPLRNKRRLGKGSNL